MRPGSRREGGATLLVTLIMLVIITLFAVTAFNTSNSNLKTVGNMQIRSEAMSASARTIEETISHPNFTTTPANAIPNPCNGTPNTLCTDLNGDGVADLTTKLTPNPTCDQGRKIKVAELHFASSQDDLACVEAQQQGTFAVVGAAPTGDSLCGQTVWNIRAETMTTGSTAATSDVKTAIVQGIGVRVPSLDVAAVCP
jgi:hypothetical protein